MVSYHCRWRSNGPLYPILGGRCFREHRFGRSAGRLSSWRSYRAAAFVPIVLTVRAPRNAWDSVKGTSKEEARELYVKKLVEVRRSPSWIVNYSLTKLADYVQILEAVDDADAKKYLAELQAVE